MTEKTSIEHLMNFMQEKTKNNHTTMTFRELIGKKGITLYTVSLSGSIMKHANMQLDKTFDGYLAYHVYIDNLDSNKTGLTASGNVDQGWGVAVFLDPNEAADLAEKIVTTKYNNSIKKINKIRQS